MGWFVDGQFQEPLQLAINPIEEAISKLEHGPANSFVISTVRTIPEPLLRFLKNKDHLVFNEQTPVPIINGYATPKTLGADRLANAVGGWASQNKGNVLIIDLGTCIKYDLVVDNVYLGGAISPGIEMRYKSMHNFTERLPLLQPDERFTDVYGKTTQSSIHAGVLKGATFEIAGFKRFYEQQFNKLTTLMTGGDVHLFEDELKNAIFAHPFLTLRGLYEIFIFNRQ